MKTLFVVQCSSGDYDEYQKWTEGIFNSPERAKRCKADILRKVETAKKIPCPIVGFENAHYERVVELSDSEFELFDSWRTEMNEAEDFNDCWIVECPLNERWTEKNTIKID